MIRNLRTCNETPLAVKKKKSKGTHGQTRGLSNLEM